MWPNSKPDIRRFDDPVPYRWLCSRQNSIAETLLSDATDKVIYRAGELIYEAGSSAKNIYFFRNGHVELYGEDGLPRPFRRCPVEGPLIFGLFEALAFGAFRSDLGATAPSLFAVIPRAKLLQIMREQPQICHFLSRSLSSLYQESVRSIMDRSRQKN